MECGVIITIVYGTDTNDWGKDVAIYISDVRKCYVCAGLLLWRIVIIFNLQFNSTWTCRIWQPFLYSVTYAKRARWAYCLKNWKYKFLVENMSFLSVKYDFGVFKVGRSAIGCFIWPYHKMSICELRLILLDHITIIFICDKEKVH